MKEEEAEEEEKSGNVLISFGLEPVGHLREASSQEEPEDYGVGKEHRHVGIVIGIYGVGCPRDEEDCHRRDEHDAREGEVSEPREAAEVSHRQEETAEREVAHDGEL